MKSSDGSSDWWQQPVKKSEQKSSDSSEWWRPPTPMRKSEESPDRLQQKSSDVSDKQAAAAIPQHIPFSTTNVKCSDNSEWWRPPMEKSEEPQKSSDSSEKQDLEAIFQHISFSTTNMRSSDSTEWWRSPKERSEESQKSSDGSSDWQQPIEPKTSAELPEVLQQQCQKWEQAIRAEQQALEGKHPWMNCSLKCTKVVTNLNTTKLTISLETLSPGSKQVFMSYYQISTPVRLRPSNAADPWKEELTGIIRDYIPAGRNEKSSPPNEVLIILRGRVLIEQVEKLKVKNSSFDIKIEENTHFGFLQFLERSNEWCGKPGYTAMLCAFKCKPLPSCEEIGPDPTDWIVENKKDTLDQSQLKALSAALNPKRPIVAIHGPPGTGKTHLLVRYLEQLRKQGKRSIVLSPSLAALYNLAAAYYEKTNDPDFIVCRTFDELLAAKTVDDPKIRLAIKKRSVTKTPVESAKTRAYYKMTDHLQHEMEENVKGRRTKRKLEDIVHLRQEKIAQSHQLTASDMRKHIEQNGQIVFTTPSRAVRNMLIRNELNFDVLVVEEAAGISEFETWWMGMPLAPIVRLFGDDDGIEQPLTSPEARELDFRQSLLERMDKEFGLDVNFHLQRQYRSAPAIQEWPNSVFYGPRSAEADESVKNIKLDDLLEPDAKMVTDPLVLVDLSRLEGEWQDDIFQPGQGGRSWFNWGEALLITEHLRQLFINNKHSYPSRIAYFTPFHAQHSRIHTIFECFSQSPYLLENLQMVRFGKTHELQGQSVDVVLKSFVRKPPNHSFKERFHLKHLAHEMTRARRQYMLLAKREWLEEGSDESRQLLNNFRNHGRIIGPNDLFQLQPGQFECIKKHCANWRRKKYREDAKILEKYKEDAQILLDDVFNFDI